MRVPPIVHIACAVILTAGAATAEPAHLRDQLRPGQLIKVEGVARDGVFHAQLVALRDVAPTAKVEGAITSVLNGGRRLQVLDFVIVVDRNARLYRGTQPTNSRAMLTGGAWIEAKGTWRDGVLQATRIRLKASPEATAEIEGVIQSTEPGESSVVILDRRVQVPPNVLIVDERTGTAVSKGADRLRRDDDDAGREPITLGNLVLGGRVEAGFVSEDNYEIARRDTDRTVLSRAQLLASSELTSTIEAYAKVTVTRNATLSGSSPGDARLSEGYVMFHQLAGAPVDLQVGRQRFRDSREWFFDDYLDAARVHVTLPSAKVEVAVSRGMPSGDHQTRGRGDQLQFLASVATHVRGAKVAGYALARRDTTRDEQPTWIGTTTAGQLRGHWSYWGDVSIRRGQSASAQLRGWAGDAGLKHQWRGRWSPTVTVGYAYGSGDDTGGDGRDTRFRQTDLEDNQAYFGGFRRVAIYGELFDPELSNLHVITAGVGVRPSFGIAMDAIYHRYAAATAARSLPSSNLEGTLNGRRRALGDELDIVLTLRAARGIDVDVAFGAFLPGAAFEQPAVAAFFWRPQVRFYF